jgi:WD40 repeat protein
MDLATTFEAHASYVLRLLFTQDGQTLISSGMDNTVKLWSVPDWSLVRILEGHTNSVNSIALSPDGCMLVTGSTDRKVNLWSFPEGELVRTLQDQKNVVAAARFSPNGAWVASGAYGGRIIIWTLDGDEVISLQASQRNVTSIAFSPDSRVLAAGGLGDDIFLWALPSGELIGTLSSHKVAVIGMQFIQGGALPGLGGVRAKGEGVGYGDLGGGAHLGARDGLHAELCVLGGREQAGTEHERPGAGLVDGRMETARRGPGRCQRGKRAGLLTRWSAAGRGGSRPQDPRVARK